MFSKSNRGNKLQCLPSVITHHFDNVRGNPLTNQRMNKLGGIREEVLSPTSKAGTDSHSALKARRTSRSKLFGQARRPSAHETYLSTIRPSQDTPSRQPSSARSAPSNQSPPSPSSKAQALKITKQCEVLITPGDQQNTQEVGELSQLILHFGSCRMSCLELSSILQNREEIRENDSLIASGDTFLQLIKATD